MNKSVTLLDYGMANLLNVARAFEYCGANVHITQDPQSAMCADRLVVPGVGAFKDCMDEIKARGFGDVINNFSLTGRPVFGICVGMQVLFDTSEEFGEHKGLGILPGFVRAIPKLTHTGISLRVPHIGWGNLVPSSSDQTWQKSLLQDFEGKSPAVYFVHSFAANPADSRDRLADCVYGGHNICAAVQRDNLIATQFHPERSGEVGLAMIRRYLCI